MKVVIHQPDFIPYIGFFHRLIHCDLFVILDHVRLSKRGWVHRDQIKRENGSEWLTLPYSKRDKNNSINTIRLNNDLPWSKNLVKRITLSYGKAPYYEEFFPHVEKEFVKEFDFMADYNINLLELLLNLLAIEVPTERSHSLNIETTSNQMNADIVHQVGGDIYLSGTGAKDYHRQEPFDKYGIKVEWQKFIHPVYPQIHGEFIPYLSIIDMLFNCGVEESRRILRSI